ncbi:MAG TPA: triose-phosphate isomerase [Polyangiales bacterium]|nr:triose-phosphate isomerase [Polyangiales bacterium]
MSSAGSGRRPLIAGNWKLHKTLAESAQLAEQIVAGSKGIAAELAVAPGFVALARVAQVVGGSEVVLSAQNAYWEAQGAFTGEVSLAQLKDVGCRYVILGHSERRQLFGDNDVMVNKKTRAALAYGVSPIVCVGETLAEREGGQAEAVVVRQVKLALADIAADAAAPIVIAYEPVWAIGTGKTAQPSDAQDMHARIRGTVSEILGGAVAEKLRILYGGSVKPDNAKTLLGQPDLDGALVGGASLVADSFLAIAAAAT